MRFLKERTFVCIAIIGACFLLASRAVRLTRLSSAEVSLPLHPAIVHILSDGAQKCSSCVLEYPRSSATALLDRMEQKPLIRPRFSLLSAWFKAEAARFGPPPKHIPPVLQDEFTMNRSIPVTEWYLDNAYLGGSAQTSLWTVELVNTFRARYRSHPHHITYAMEPVYSAMVEWAGVVQGKRGLVVGSETPWVEALLLEHEAKTITTLEFGSITSEHPQIDCWTPEEFKVAFWQGKIPQFDFAFTYSSIEHDGLGRYGDVLNPKGDLQTMAKLLSIVKPGGFLFLGVMCCRDELVWNAHRSYGSRRTPELLAGWTLLGSYPTHDAEQPLWVLQNTFACL